MAISPFLPCAIFAVLPLLVLANACLVLDGILDVCFVCLLAQWSQIRIGGLAFWYGKTHCCEHCILFGFFELALFLSKLLGSGLLIVVVAFGIPVEIATLLPTTNSYRKSAKRSQVLEQSGHTRHERMAEIILALRVLLDILPFEFGAAAAVARSVKRMWL